MAMAVSNSMDILGVAVLILLTLSSRVRCVFFEPLDKITGFIGHAVFVTNNTGSGIFHTHSASLNRVNCSIVNPKTANLNRKRKIFLIERWSGNIPSSNSHEVTADWKSSVSLRFGENLKIKKWAKATFTFGTSSLRPNLISRVFGLGIFPDRQNDRTNFLSKVVLFLGLDLLQGCSSASNYVRP